jgi:hypothetical protein
MLYSGLGAGDLFAHSGYTAGRKGHVGPVVNALAGVEECATTKNKIVHFLNLFFLSAPAFIR